MVQFMLISNFKLAWKSPGCKKVIKGHRDPLLLAIQHSTVKKGQIENV